jgi:hypothetical protein
VSRDTRESRLSLLCVQVDGPDSAGAVISFYFYPSLPAPGSCIEIKLYFFNNFNL